jgi:acetyl esterase/lipase
VSGVGVGLYYFACKRISDLYTDENKIQMRMYEPKTTLHQDKRPVFYYFHGGGFSLMSIGKVVLAAF